MYIYTIIMSIVISIIGRPNSQAVQPVLTHSHFIHFATDVSLCIKLVYANVYCVIHVYIIYIFTLYIGCQSVGVYGYAQVCTQRYSCTELFR